MIGSTMERAHPGDVCLVAPYRNLVCMCLETQVILGAKIQDEIIVFLSHLAYLYLVQ